MSSSKMMVWDEKANEHFWEQVSKQVEELLVCQTLVQVFPSLQDDLNQLFGSICQLLNQRIEQDAEAKADWSFIHNECSKRELPVYVVPKRPATEDVKDKPAPFYLRKKLQPYMANIVISNSQGYIEKEARDWGYLDMKSIPDADRQACGIAIIGKGMSQAEFSADMDRVFRSRTLHRVHFFQKTKTPPTKPTKKNDNIQATTTTASTSAITQATTTETPTVANAKSN